jgi:two-component system sensor histidine kinase VicK
MQTDLYNALAENSPLACFVYDINNERFKYVNPVFRALIEIEGPIEIKSILAMIPKKDLSYLKKVYTSFINGVYENDIQFRIIFSDKREKWVNVNSSFLGHGEKLIYGYAKNVTNERENVESIMKYANKKNSVLTILAHDLTGLLGIAQNVISVLEKKVDDAYLKKLIENIAKINAQSINLIQDLVQRELLETTDVVIYKKRVNAASKLREMVEEYKNSEELTKRSFDFYTSSENILMDLDEPKFIQIINNLVSNALKFTYDNGTIKVRIEEKTDSVLFTFSDNGIGIPAGFHNLVFEKFTPAKRPGLRGEPTIGLGLYIIKMIVEWHNGKIWVESEENKGTSFYFEIPYQSS